MYSQQIWKGFSKFKKNQVQKKLFLTSLFVWKGHHQSPECTRMNASFARKPNTRKGPILERLWHRHKSSEQTRHCERGPPKKVTPGLFHWLAETLSLQRLITTGLVTVTIPGQTVNNPARKCPKTQIQIHTKQQLRRHMKVSYSTSKRNWWQIQMLFLQSPWQISWRTLFLLKSSNI